MTRCTGWWKRLGWVVAAASLAGTTAARELFVDQRHAEANDQNPGTEAKPFKTIQPAVNGAQPGDTIYIKEGLYSDAVKIFHKSGFLDQPITIQAWKDDHVTIGFTLHALPSADQWKPVPGSKSWAAKLAEAMPEDGLVLINDKAVVTQRGETPAKDDNVGWCVYRASDQTLMINSNGKPPAELGKLAWRRDAEPFVVDRADYWIIKKLEFAFLHTGLVMDGSSCVVESCYFHDTTWAAIFLHGRTDQIRRCAFYRCGYGLFSSGVGPACIIEDNVLVECGQSAEEDITQVGRKFPEGGGPTVFKGNNLGMLFDYNTVADNKAGAGWYADIDAKSCRIVNNAFWNNAGGGIYNEYAVDDTVVMGNYFLQNGCTSAMNVRWYILDNYFDESSVCLLQRDWWPQRFGFVTVRGNAFINPPGGYLHHFAAGWTQTSYPESFNGCLVDHNRIRMAPGAVWINDGGANRRVMNIEEIRKFYGWELHGEGKEYTPAANDLTPEAMGGSVMTYRVPWGKRSHLARPMLSNGSVETRFPGAPELVSSDFAPASFWRLADGNYQPETLHTYEPWSPYLSRYQPTSNDGYDQGERVGCRWYVDAEDKYPEDLKAKMPKDWTLKTISQRVWLANGNHWLVMMGMEPAKMPPQGVGYWTPWLTTADGAQITVSLRIRGRDIVSDDRGSPAVWLEFTTATGQKKSRAYLVGKDEQGVFHRSNLTDQSYDWTNIAETVVAPEGARRMALFFGVLPCKATLNFDDIDLRTASVNVGITAEEILLPRLPLAKFRGWNAVDLSKVANRVLADEEANDGKGGWTDQGPNCDLRALPAGEQSFGGVRFKILAGPNSVVVLKGANRPKDTLPDRVTIPMNQKADTLFFLHAAAWAGGNEFFRYVIHYADGKDIVVPVGATNMRDWSAEPVVRFPTEAITFSTVAATVKVPQFRQASIYRLEWSAPPDRRSIDIQSIEMIGNGQTVPVLLGITAVLEW
jgi:hypothetical protein